MPIKKVINAIEENRQILEAHGQSMDSKLPMAKNTTNAASTKPYKATVPPKVPNNKVHPKKGRNNTRKPVNSTRRTTLLEMLLAPDIRHERNVILQCVRYVVQNNFFDCTLKSEQQVTSESSPAKPAKHINGETKSKVESEQNVGLHMSKAPVVSSFLRQLEPVDDEIWETDASGVETFAI